jgi:putative ABC transport system permease protein
MKTRVWWKRATGMFGKTRGDREIGEELASHVAMHTEDNLRAGMTAEAARREALMKLGGVEKTKEEYRDTRGITWLETLAQDFSFGARILRKNYGFSLVAITALALGIGFSAVVFSIFYNGVLHPFPYRAADRLTAVEARGGKAEQDVRAYFSMEEINRFRKENHTFEDIVGYSGWEAIYKAKGISQSVHGCVLTPNGMEFWGVRPLLGRGLSEQDLREDGTAASSPVVLLAFGFWKREFRQDKSVVGTTMLLDGQPRTIVGVMPERFALFGADFYALVSWKRPDPTFEAMMAGEPRDLLATGIVKAHVKPEAVAADLQTIADRFTAEQKKDLPEQFRMRGTLMSEAIVGDFKETMIVLIGTVALLLFISSSNVASLLLVHNSGRAKEIALRTALGAGRGRLIRQLLMESFLLGIAGCAAGSFLAYAGLRTAMALRTVAPLQIPGEADVSLNLPVLFFAVGVSLITTLLFGMSPAFIAVGKDVQGTLQGAGVNAKASERGTRVRSVLVVGQVALSLLLMVFAGLMIRSFVAVTHFDYGFNTRNILVADVRFPAKGYESAESKRTYFEAALPRLAALPGVTNVATSIGLPLEGGPGTNDVTIPGRPHDEKWETAIEAVSEGYFQTLGLQLLHGRTLSASEVAGAKLVAVVNRTMVEKYFAGQDPVGSKIKFNEFDDIPVTPHNTYYEIVGVVSDFKNGRLEHPVLPQAFIPYTFSGIGDRSLMLRAAVEPTALLNTVRLTLADVDSGPVVARPGTLDEFLEAYDLVKPRFRVISFSVCAGIGLGLSMIGLFGVMAYSVALQTHDLGVRMALGAQTGNILSLVMRQGLILVGSGVLAGLVAALLCVRLLRSQLFGVSAFDMGAFLLASLALLVTGLLACYLPARRATRVDPLVALRYE